MEKPDYADFDSAAKFNAILSIIGKRLREHPNACCSYSGGSDSDTMLDLIERARKMFNLPPVKYFFVNTGLEMAATKRHVKEMAEKYNINIETIKPKISIVTAVRRYGLPFMTKIYSGNLANAQRHGVPYSIRDEFEAATDKKAKFDELCARYPSARKGIETLCSCDGNGKHQNSQISIDKAKYLIDFMKLYPVPFKISSSCCTYCKKKPSHEVQAAFDLVITGERMAEGGQRVENARAQGTGCFAEEKHGYRLKPLFYVSDKDKAWYKERYKLRYSDAYEVYGLKRTGCCGCPIAANAVDELKQIGKYEPQLEKAAWNVFGESYRYRQAYVEYKNKRLAEDRISRSIPDGQTSLFDTEE